MEDLLYIVAYGDLEYGEAGMVVEVLVESHQGRARMLSLFNKLAYGSFAEETKDLGFQDFARAWDALAKERNRFVHHSHRDRRSDELEFVDLAYFAEDALALFMELNNRYLPVRL